jgi:hypothetical protein
LFRKLQQLIGPDLTSQDEFNINRARLGALGVAPLSDGKINHYFLAEPGKTGILPMSVSH